MKRPVRQASTDRCNTQETVEGQVDGKMRAAINSRS